MDALSQILAALSVKSYTATGVRGGGFSIAYPAYPGMKLLVPRTGNMGLSVPLHCLKLKAPLIG